MSTLDGGRRSIRPGSWFGVFGERATVVLPPSEKARVAALWEIVDDGAGFDEVLDALIAGGLRELPGFVLVSDLDGTTKIVLRGAASASFVSGGETVELDGASATTWVERSLPDVSSMRLVLETDEADPDTTDLLIADGLARVASVQVPAELAASPAPAAAVAADDVDEPDGDTADGAGDGAEGGDPEVLVAGAAVPEEGGEPGADEAAGDEAPGWDVDTEPSTGNSDDAVADSTPPAQTEPLDGVDAQAAAGVGAGPGGVPPDLLGPDTPSGHEPDAQEGVPTDPAPAGPLSLDKRPEADGSSGDPGQQPVVDDQQPTGQPPSAPAFGQPPAWPDPDQQQPDHPQPDHQQGGDWQQGPPQQPAWGQPQQPEQEAWQPEAAPSNPWANPPQGGNDWAPGPDQGQGGGVDHDGMTRAGDYDPAEFARQPAGIPGQPQAPHVTAQPVARLAFSHGESVDVDRVIIVGRAPEARRFTSTEQPRLVTVPSPNQEISSTHLEVRPGSGADHGTAVVTDLGSTNGTVLLQPGLPPEELNPGIAVQLIPGAVIDLGDGLTIQVAPPG